MSAFHCSCGFAIDDAAEFGDHLGEVFERPGDLGADGRVHAELAAGTGPRPGFACVCGFHADTAAELDDHLLLVLIPPDGIGNDGDKHIPVDPSTPGRWYIAGPPGALS